MSVAFFVFFLQMLYKLIKEWPTDLYSTQTIVNAVDVSSYRFSA